MQDVSLSLSTQSEQMRASPRLFENAILDKLSRIHWSVPLFIYVPILAALVALGFIEMPPSSEIGGILLGYTIWTLIEYFGHRFLFHWEFPGKLGARIHFLIHGVHHIHPSDPLRLVMPCLLSGPIMLIACGVTRLLFGPVFGLAVLTGFIIGYLIYDMTHFYIHHAEPRTNWGKFMKRAHLLHHFQNPERGFGVSAPWWDYVFQTQFTRTRSRQRA